MNRLVMTLVGLAVFVPAVGYLPGTNASAADQAEQDPSAAEMVAEALRCEVDGLNARRDNLLALVLHEDPNHAPALWHSGYVRAYNKWLKHDEVPELVAEDERLTRYRHVRQEYPETIEGQLALAGWCAKKKLYDQQRVHLTKVLEIDPDHQQARHLLGYRLLGGVWLSREEMFQAATRARQVVTALREWEPKLRKILAELAHRSTERREKAAEQLRAINDPAAIQAIELVFCAHDEESALLGIETLDQIVAPETAEALARQAVFSPWQMVREAAAERLKTRDKHGYVPTLLAAMQTPIESRAGLYVTPAGRLTYRHMFYREGQDQRAVAVFDTNYYRSILSAVDPNVGTAVVHETRTVPPGSKVPDGEEVSGGRVSGWRVETLSPREQSEIARRDAAMKARAMEMAVAQQNAMIRQFNHRICWVLSAATGAIIPPTPEDWWKWWNDYNEVYVTGYKPLRTAYRRDNQDILGGVSVREDTDLTVRVRYQARRSCCLAAGTPVWTESGPMAIERIKTGDRVLSQDVETGELAYKPVLKTTVRPPAELLNFEVDGETITCIGGHPFWVCGDGWVKARELVPGTPFHCVDGTAKIKSIGPAGKAPAYNLVVADFHSYFVGRTTILSHDNTIRRPTSALVPGLADR